MRLRQPARGVEALWEAYGRDGSRASRDQLILHYAPIVKYVAARVGSGLPSSVDPADLVSYGMFGLIDAIERFDASRGVKFETYAASRIRGAIVDELRHIDWVPRSLRAQARAIAAAEARLEAELGRSPTDAELAAALTIPVDVLARTLTKLSRSALVALDEAPEEHRQRNGRDSQGQRLALVDTLVDTRYALPGDQLERADTSERLARAIASLPERHRTILGLYYVEELTLAEIGRALGVTESRVCQIHARAVLQLRSRLASVARD